METGRSFKLLWMAYMLACASSAHAVESFKLGEVSVTAPKLEVTATSTDTITQQQIQTFNRETLLDALNLLPGVSVANTGARNEPVISLRGYDARQVPLFIDGIPVYVPYDGYVDLSRFLTSDLASIQVAKGYSSVSYGPNTLGGAVNLVSRKPVKTFEADARAGYGQENTRSASANVGSNQGNWYFQAGVGYRESDGYRLSSDYVPTALENGGRRDNSQYQDNKASLKLGITPNDTDEYAISYYRQDGEKGQPPSIVPTARYWKWPHWDKESLYFVSSTALGAHETLKLRLYQDTFNNEINAYTDGTYTRLLTTGGISTGRSIYNDKTYGGSAELESSRVANNTLRVVAHYKNDQHEQEDANALIGEMFEDTFRSLSVEDSFILSDKAILSAGFAHHELTPDSVYKVGSAYTLPEKQIANDPQIAWSYALNPAVSFYASAAQKTRLPTLKDRYSNRLGSYIENTNLQAEEAKNYELGYKGSPWATATAQIAVFLNDIDNKIQSVNLAGAATCTTTTLCQQQNVGKTRFKGLEVSLNSKVGDRWLLGGNLTRMSLEVLNDAVTKIIGVPETKVILHATWQPLNAIKVIALAEYNGERWASNTVQLDGFTLINLKAVWESKKGLAAEIGVNNLTDKNYSLDYGFPSAGRMWFSNLAYSF